MNTVLSRFAATVAFLVFAIGGRFASCQSTVLVQKCCPPGQSFDPKVRFCGPAAADPDEYQQRLRDGFRAVSDAVMVDYDYEQPMCDDTQVLVDVSAVELRRLMEADPSAAEFRSGYCFDLTPSDEPVARTCRPHDNYCGKVGYTSVNTCCPDGKNFVIDDSGYLKCKQSEEPFKMSAYEIDADGRPGGLSNSTVQQYHVNAPFYSATVEVEIYFYEFMLTTDGSIYSTDKKPLVTDNNYCVDYTKTTDKSEAHLFVYIWKDTAVKRGSWMYLFIQASYVTSSVCLVLTLIVYATLPSLRNVHGYYVMCYLACLLVLCVCDIINLMIQNNIKIPFSSQFSYLFLFAILMTYCWLNVICFDIYCKIRYNHSINRNTSTSVRTIMYHIYCWGFPSICISTSHFIYESQYLTPQEVVPYIGDFICFFYDCTTFGKIVFLIMVVSIMLTANLILFVLTAIHCSRIKSELNKFNPTDSKKESFLVNKEKFIMNIKLFLIMGIQLSLHIKSAFVKNEWPIWELYYEINRLQGVFVFIVLVAKRKVITDIRKKFRGSMDHRQSTQVNTISAGSS